MKLGEKLMEFCGKSQIIFILENAREGKNMELDTWKPMNLNSKENLCREQDLGKEN